MDLVGEGRLDTKEGFRDEKKENLSRRISFWLSFIFATAMTIWYCVLNPIESAEVKQMRLFFKENILDVAKFIRLPQEDLEEFSKTKSHPFYQTYLKSSEVEKEKINALIHMSSDYTPNQYWFNIIFLWIIAFTTLWFLGLILEAVIILVRQEDAEKKWRRKHKSE